MDNMNLSSQKTSRLGAWMFIAAWILIFALFAWLFQDWIFTPKSTEFKHTQAGMEITLHRHYDHHFRLKGKINGQSTTFLIDTGATTIAVPITLAKAANLPKYTPVEIQTANGKTLGYFTRIKELQLNDIIIKNVSAIVSPNMNEQEALLGMNILKKFKMIQQQDTLKLTVPKPKFIKKQK